MNERKRMFKEYGKLSTMLYEHTKPAGASVSGDIEYYSATLRDVKSPVLEAGVGTGRMLIPLIQRGLTVDGVDQSADMLVQCETNLKKHGCGAQLYRQDLTELSLPGKYGAIIMPTGSFCLLPRDAAARVLASFYNHLEVGGRIMIDLVWPVGFTKGAVEARTYPLQDETGILFTGISQSMDWIAQKTSYIHKYELLKNSDAIQTEIAHFTLYWYGVAEFEMLLGYAGFTEISYVVGYGNQNQTSPVTFTAVR
jgi:SAM-dependent methyltransferase